MRPSHSNLIIKASNLQEVDGKYVYESSCGNASRIDWWRSFDKRPESRLPDVLLVDEAIRETGELRQTMEEKYG